MAALINITDIFRKKSEPAPDNTPQTQPVSPKAPVPQVRVVFMGTPTLAQELLQTLLEAGYNIVGVVTKPDTKIGREQTLKASPVKELAESKGIPVLTPTKIDHDFEKELSRLRPDLIIVAAYGKILPESLLSLPGLGCLNVHYSLLPRFRGASPIQNALLFGDKETGVTLMKMDAGLDTGNIIATKNLAIDPHDTTLTLTAKLNSVAQTLLLETLPLWVKQKIQSTPQKKEGVVLCQLIERADGKIEWSTDAESIYNRFRAFQPWPGIFTFWKQGDSFARIKLIDIELHTLPVSQSYALGEVFQLADVLGVQTGNGVIILRTLQLEGKVKMPAADFIRGNPDFIGGTLV